MWNPISIGKEIEEQRATIRGKFQRSGTSSAQSQPRIFRFSIKEPAVGDELRDELATD